jgi:hypothetical protein
MSPAIEKRRPGITAKLRQAKARKDARYAKTIRSQVAARDGECRIGNWEAHPDDVHADALESEHCDGVSEWAHLGDRKRFRTRGQAPSLRHTTAGSVMLCTNHHRMYDRGELTIIGDDADSVLSFWL